MLRAIKCIRNVRRLPLESYLSRVKFSSYDDDYEYTSRDPKLNPEYNDWKQGGPRGGNDFSNIVFDDVFHVPRYEDIHEVPEGGYVDFSLDELDRLMPEGLAGEMDKEFASSERLSWMIRDSTKLLCRIMEEFENTSRKNRGDFEFTPKRTGIATPVNLPGLTDRKEWPDATLKAFYYGAELNPGFVRKIFAEGESPDAASPDGTADGDAKDVEVAAVPAGAPVESRANVEPINLLYTVRGDGSRVEEFVKTLQADGKVIPDRIMLTGDRGVGKSCTLNQAVMWARERGWICLFIPQGWEQVWGGEYIEPLTFDRPWIVEEDIARQDRMMENYEDSHRSIYQFEKSIPRADGTIYDNASQSAIVLRGLWWAHGDLLGTIPLQFPEALTKYGPAMDSFGEAYDRVKSMQGRERMSFIEVRQVVDDDEVDEESEEVDDAILRHYKYHSAFRPSNLEELVMTGIAFPDLSGPIFMDIVAELRALDLPDHPVLFAVDEYNYWESPSSFHYRHRPVVGKEMCVPSVLQFVSQKKADSENYSLKNGICIGATSLKHPIKKLVTYEDHKSSIPLVIRVPCYSQVESAAVVSYYQKENLIDPGMRTQDIVAYRMLSGSNGRNTRLECTSFFFPLSVRRSLESGGEDTTFRYADAPFQVSDRSSRSAGSDDDDDDDDAPTHVASKKKFSPKSKK